jgi:hypothetical protein
MGSIAERVARQLEKSEDAPASALPTSKAVCR